MGRIKLQPNQPCPCGSGKKYKKCCQGKVDWPGVLAEHADATPYMSVRGRNQFFLTRLVESLQLDTANPPKSSSEFKKAFTAQAVKQIHEAVIAAWPPDTDLRTALRPADSQLSGLYVGDYSQDYILQGLIRHSLYADKILVVDPFQYPPVLREEYNPILNPEQFRAQTLENVHFWFSLAPWIDAGIVEIVRTPADFDVRFLRESMERQRRKFVENSDLKDAAEKTVRELQRRHGDRMRLRNTILSAPNSVLRRGLAEAGALPDGVTEDDFIAYIEELRANDPLFLEPLAENDSQGQLRTFSTGASYDVAAATCTLTGSYLMTDLYAKWKEIELDRDHENPESEEWSPVAKAFQELEWSCLNNVTLDHALEIRQEGHLRDLRALLRRIWKATSSSEPFSEANARFLGDELKGEAALAKDEWKRIHQTLLQQLGTTTALASPLILSGHAVAFGAATLGTGAVTAWGTWCDRQSFRKRHPAAFFLRLPKSV